MSQGNFANANTVASALQSGTYAVSHTQDAPGVNYDMLVAYQGNDGNAHIADLNWVGAGSTTLKGDASVVASDIVTLVGVTINQLAANSSHVHLVT